MRKFAAVLLLLVVGLQGIAQESPRKLEISGAIDRILEQRWKDVKDGPASLCSDSEFLRRLSLDLRAFVPGPEEVSAFVASTSSTKRQEKIDEYLATDAYAIQMSHWLGQVLFVDYKHFAIYPGKNFSGTTTQRLQHDFMNWLKEQVAKDVPMINILRDLLDAKGKTSDSPLVLYKMSMYDGEPAHLEFADKFTKAWLGVRISCARCHEHPFDKWTQENFYGMAGFFSRTKIKPLEVKGDACSEAEIYEDLKSEELKNPDSGGFIKPTFLYGGALGSADPRMASLAAMASRRDHNQLARNFANRLWAWLMGKGIVSPVDDFNLQNRPTIPELLNALTNEFANGKYSLKHLIRGICASGAYQRASMRPNATGDAKDFARSTIRQLTVEQLWLSIACVAMGPEALEDRENGYTRNGWDQYAQQMSLVYGPGVGWTEISFLPGNPRQMLMLRNSEIFQEMFRGEDRLPGKVMASGAPLPQKVEQIFLAVLGRTPIDAERIRWAKWLDKNKSAQGVEDMIWTLVNSTEFITRH